MSLDYLFSLKFMLVLFVASFVHFYFIVADDNTVKPHPFFSFLQNKIKDKLCVVMTDWLQKFFPFFLS